jgi:hypothetical protein
MANSAHFGPVRWLRPEFPFGVNRDRIEPTVGRPCPLSPDCDRFYGAAAFREVPDSEVADFQATGICPSGQGGQDIPVEDQKRQSVLYLVGVVARGHDPLSAT